MANSYCTYYFYLLYKLAESHIIPGFLYHEKIFSLVVVIHPESIYELASLKFLKLNLEYHNRKMGRRGYERTIFLSRYYVLNQHHAIGYHSCFYSCSLFLKSSYYNSYTWPKSITLAVR